VERRLINDTKFLQPEPFPGKKTAEAGEFASVFQNARTTQTLTATGRFSDLHPTERILPACITQAVEQSPIRISDFSERTLTAARPSRNFTAFPFAYPGIGSQDLQLTTLNF